MSWIQGIVCFIFLSLIGGCAYVKVKFSIEDCERVHPESNLFVCLIFKGAR